MGGPKTDLGLLCWKMNRKVVSLIEKRGYEEKPAYEEEAFENRVWNSKPGQGSNIDLEVI